MGTLLELHKHREWTQQHGDMGWKAWNIQAKTNAHEPVGCYFEGPKTRVIAWPGMLDFGNLHAEFISLTTTILNTPINPDFSETPNETTATFLTTDNTPPLKLNLNDPLQRQQYTHLLQDSTRVAFARYDVSDTFSFTAENPVHLMPGQKAQLAIGLVKSTAWTPEIIDWIKTHHVDSIGMEKVDPKEATVIFSTV